MVSNALSWKSHASIYTLYVCTWKMLNTLKDFDLFVSRKKDTAFVFNLTVRPTFIQRAIAIQSDDLELKTIERQITDVSTPDGWMIDTDGGLQYLGRIVVPNDESLR